MKFTITPPPSANAIWRNVKGRTLKSRVYRQWLKSQSWEVKLQRRGEYIAEPCSVTLSMRRPRANADLDNRIKPVLDCLEAGGAILNDKQVVRIEAEWADHDGCRVTVAAA